jgi:hypothetical protein
MNRIIYPVYLPGRHTPLPYSQAKTWPLHLHPWLTAHCLAELQQQLGWTEPAAQRLYRSDTLH